MKGFSNKFVSVTFLCAVFCFSWSTQDKKNLRVPAALVLSFRQEAEVCGKETGVPSSYVSKILSKTLPDELSSLQFFYCMATKTGFADSDGHFVPDKMTSFEVVDGTVEDYVNTIKECNKIVKDNNLQTLDATSNCIHKAYSFVAIAPK